MRQLIAIRRQAASRRNPRCERPVRVRTGDCATVAYPTDCPKRAFELPIPHGWKDALGDAGEATPPVAGIAV